VPGLIATATPGAFCISQACTRAPCSLWRCFLRCLLPQQQSLLTDVQKILVDGGASFDAAVDVVTDLKAVAAETK